jgi:hypothetical protein
MAAPTYSVILPTYNERDNLPLMVWLLNKAFEERCDVSLGSSSALLWLTVLGQQAELRDHRD